MVGVFTYICQTNQPNVDRYTSPMDPMGHINKTLLEQFFFEMKEVCNHMGVSKNNGVLPQIVHLFIGFPLFSPSILGFFPLFLDQHPYESICA